MVRRVLVACGLSILLAPLMAGMQGKDKGKNNKGDAGASLAAAVHVFTDADRMVLREYARGFRGDLPPGLAKRGGNLPPGLEKQLVRKGHLPPGLEKQMAPFPVEIERRLSPLEPGYRRGFIAGHAIIFNTSTRAIFDVFVPLD